MESIIEAVKSKETVKWMEGIAKYDWMYFSFVAHCVDFLVVQFSSNTQIWQMFRIFVFLKLQNLDGYIY